MLNWLGEDSKIKKKRPYVRYHKVASYGGYKEIVVFFHSNSLEAEMVKFVFSNAPA